MPMGDLLIPQHISNAPLQAFLSGAAASQPEQKLSHLGQGRCLTLWLFLLSKVAAETE